MESLKLCPAYDGGCVALSGMMLNSGSSDGNLNSTGSSHQSYQRMDPDHGHLHE